MNEVLNTAKKYTRIRHNIALFEIAFTLSFLLIMHISGFSLKLKSFSLYFSANSIVVVALYIFFLSACFNIFSFWLDYFGGYKLEHKFALSRQSFASWVKDYFKKILIGGILYLILVEVLYVFLRRFPDSWWLWAACFWLFLSLFVAKIFPVFIIPLFYKLEKLDNENLKTRLLNLGKASGVKIVDIYKIGLGAKTKKANAALTGLGASKRIILSDTLLNDYSSEEIEAALAHELAHHKYRHIWKLVLFNTIVTITAFLFVSVLFDFIVRSGYVSFPIYDIGAFPILAFLFVLFNTVIIPVQNALSRYFETQADEEALNLTKNPQAFISLIEKLTKQNLSDPDPGKLAKMFFYDHPPSSKRVRVAREKI